MWANSTTNAWTTAYLVTSSPPEYPHHPLTADADVPKMLIVDRPVYSRSTAHPPASLDALGAISGTHRDRRPGLHGPRRRRNGTDLP